MTARIASAPAGVGEVLVIGEALIDVVAVAGCSEVVEHVGGSPANVALALARLGVPVRLRTALGDDERGRRIAAHLGRAHVRIDPGSWTLPRTSTARATIQSDGAALYEFDVDWTLAEPGEDALPAAVHVGSVGAFLPPGADAVLDAVVRLGPSTIVSYDPNVRPALFPDRADALRKVDALVRWSDIVKLSDEDAAWLYPDVALDDVLRRLVDAGVAVAAVTCGARGAVLASEHGRVEIAAPVVPVSDTVGAGDTFTAGLLEACVRDAGLLASPDESALLELGAWAAAAAAVTVQRPGADPPTRDELLGALSAREPRATRRGR